MRGAMLSQIDWVIVFAYAIALVTIGLTRAHRFEKAEDYFLASRSSRWPTVGLALIASNITSMTLVGLAGGAYSIGVAVFDYEWSACVVLVFYCVFLLPFVLATRVYTMPEYLERRYDGRARLYFAVLTLVLSVAIECAGALFCGSLVCRMMFPQAPIWLIVVLLAGAAGLYAVLGGLRAVIHTEAVQAVVLLLGASAIAGAAFHHAGGWRHVMSSVDPAKLSLLRPSDDPGVPWTGLVLGIPVLGFYYWCTNQNIVQRVLSARDIDQGRRGVLFAGALKLPLLFLMVLPGSCALLLFPDLAHADLVYPTLMFQLLPSGLMGLAAASFVAATMASVASTLNSASTLITMDIIRPLRPHLPDRSVVRSAQMATVLLFVLATLWAPQLQQFPSLWQYLQGVLAYAVPPVVALFIVGMFWRGANASGAVATLQFGTLCGALMFVSNVLLHWTHLHFLYVTPILLGIDCAILVGVSLCSRAKPDPRASALIWTRAHLRDERREEGPLPLWRNYRFQASCLLALTAWLVIAFR